MYTYVIYMYIYTYIYIHTYIHIYLPYPGWAFFGAAHGWGGPKWLPFPKICHTYPTMRELDTVIPCLKNT